MNNEATIRRKIDAMRKQLDELEAELITLVREMDSNKTGYTYPLDELGLPVKTRNALIAAGLSTIQDVIELVHSKKLVKGIGNAAWVEIKERLMNGGYDS